MKINKVFSAPYNGVSEQVDELVLDSQCREMINVIPDIVQGIYRRNGTDFIKEETIGIFDKLFHAYDRGDGVEAYLFGLTSDDGIKVFKTNGDEVVVNYKADFNYIKEYLGDSPRNLKALTIQDRTFLLNKNIQTSILEKELPPTTVVLHRREVIINNVSITPQYMGYKQYKTFGVIHLAVHLNGEGTYHKSVRFDNEFTSGNAVDVTSIVKGLWREVATEINTLTDTTVVGDVIERTSSFFLSLNIWWEEGGLGTLSTASYRVKASSVIDGADYKQSAFYWLKRASNDVNHPYRYAVYLDGTVYEYSGHESDKSAIELANIINNSPDGFIAEVSGTVLKIYHPDKDFSFSYWDSWGTQASFGWKGTVARMTDLPSELGFENTIVKIIGTDNSEFTDYFVEFKNNSWIETKDPYDLRGTLYNMPIYVDRIANGEFEVGLVDWSEPRVGDEETNPSPSFINRNITDIFFFKNRLGFVSGDSVILSETANYGNFFISTALDVIDSDPIDISVASNRASQLFYAEAFQRSLFVFSQDSQHEIVYEGVFSPRTVNIVTVSNYDTDVNVAPVTAGSSLFFISRTSNNLSQLREYSLSGESLIAEGTNIAIHIPNYIPKIRKIVSSTVLSMTFLHGENNSNEIVIYKVFSNGNERVQSAFFKWVFPFNIYFIAILNEVLYISTIYNGKSILLKLPILDDKIEKVDYILNDAIPFESSIKLNIFLPTLNKVKSKLNPIIINRISVSVIGSILVKLFKKAYSKIITKLPSRFYGDTCSTSILSRADDIEINIVNKDEEQFFIQGYILEGQLNITRKEIQ